MQHLKNSTNFKAAELIFITSKLIHVQIHELLDKNLMERNMIQPKLETVSLVKMIQETIQIL